jgi:hypothetical protein
MTHDPIRRHPTLTMPAETAQAFASHNRRGEPSAADLAPARASHATRRAPSAGENKRSEEARFDPRAWRHNVQQEEAPVGQGMGPVVDHGAAGAAKSGGEKTALRAAAPGGVSRHGPSNPGPWRYAAVWASLGAVSAGFIAMSAWQRSFQIDTALAPVTESLERVATDIAELKQTTAALDQRERATAVRLAAAESRLGEGTQTGRVTASVEPAAAHGQRPTNRQVIAEEQKPQTTAAAAPALEPIKPGRVIAGIALANTAPPPPPGLVETKAAKAAPPKPAASPIRTGSLTDAAPVAEAPLKPSGLLIASGPSLDAVRLSWNVLSQNHGAVLGALEPRILPSSDGSSFQLIAGPFANEADAQKTCTALRSRGVTCRGADYRGAAL